MRTQRDNLLSTFEAEDLMAPTVFTVSQEGLPRMVSLAVGTSDPGGSVSSRAGGDDSATMQSVGDETPRNKLVALFHGVNN